MTAIGNSPKVLFNYFPARPDTTSAGYAFGKVPLNVGMDIIDNACCSAFYVETVGNTRLGCHLPELTDIGRVTDKTIICVVCEDQFQVFEIRIRTMAFSKYSAAVSSFFALCSTGAGLGFNRFQGHLLILMNNKLPTQVGNSGVI